MCQSKTSESEMKIIRVVKSKGFNLYTGMLNVLVFSSIVGYLDRIFTVRQECLLFSEDDDDDDYLFIYYSGDPPEWI